MRNEENAPLPEELTEVAKELQQTLTKLGGLKRRARMEVNKSINELRGFNAKEAEETAQAQASAQDEEHADFDPYRKVEVLVSEIFDVEADGRYRLHSLVDFEFVKNRGLSRCVQTEHQNPAFFVPRQSIHCAGEQEAHCFFTAVLMLMFRV